MVWNRQRFLKDPDTGKRVARPNPQSEWIVKEVLELRIIDDETWNAVRDRYASVQRKWSSAAKGDRFRQFRRPKYLFSGLTKCGECDAGFIVHSREFLGCFGARDRGTCTNRLRISRLEVEARVLNAVQTKLLRKEIFEEFCHEYAKQMNRLRMERRAGQSSAKRELERVRRDIQKVIEAIKAGYTGPELKAEMDALQMRKEALLSQLKSVNEPPTLLHPSVADLYRTKIEQLAAALQREDTRLEASEMLRGFIDSIVLTPEKGQLRIELRGNLAAMLTVAQETTRSPESGDLIVPVQLVAGARNHLDLEFAWAAA
jgi:hypothetical protein